MSAVKTILIADDDESDVFFLKRALAKTGAYNLQVVSDGRQAIEYLAGEGAFADRQRFPQPSCVIVDLKLPEKDGLEILEWMKSSANCSKIPALVCSGCEHAAQIDRARQLGAFSFLPKPPDQRTVTRLMASLRA